MKKTLLTFAMLIPTLLFAQSRNGTDDFIAFVVVLVIAAIVFFFLRGVMLWYWKIDTIVKNQEETNRLLKSTLRRLESKDDYLNSESRTQP